MVSSKSKMAKNWIKIKNQKYLFLMLSPAVVLAILFSYAPLTGLWMSFTNFSPTGAGYFHDLFNAPFVGLDWFRFFLENDFTRVMRNTLVMSMLTLLIGFPLPIMIAIFLNEVRTKKLKTTLQTTSYLPYFISWVIAANFMLVMFGANGPINQILLNLGWTEERILFFQNGRMFWWIIAASNTWKVMGYNAIIYLAAISGIPQDQFEAADIDGASRWQKIFYITLPTLRPTIVIMLILAVGNVLNTGFEQVLLLQNNAIFSYSDVLDTYIFRFGLNNGMFSYATAIGLFRSLVSFGLVFGANMIARKKESTSLF